MATEIDVKDAAGDTVTVATNDAVMGLVGALDDAAETDPDAASATMLALLRGILTALNTIATNTEPAE